LFTVFGIDAEDTRGIGGFQANRFERAVVGLIDRDTDFLPVGTKVDGATLTNHILNKVVGTVVGGIKVVVSEVDRNVDALDIVGRVKTYLDVVAIGM
jgi:hypothetical protein